MKSEAVERWERAYRLRFALERGSRYYALFDNRWTAVRASVKVLGFVAFLFSLVFLLRPCPPALACAFPIAGMVAYVFDFCLRIDDKVAANRRKAAAFREMAESIPAHEEDLSDWDYAELQRKRREMESGEIAFPCVSAMMHNEVARSRSAAPEYALSLWERTVGRMFPVRYTPKPMTDGFDRTHTNAHAHANTNPKRAETK